MNIKTPTQITRFLDQNVYKFDCPEWTYGDEPNTNRWTDEEWEDAPLRTIIFSPFDYMNANGNTTIPLLYRLANDRPGTKQVAERCYYPASHREVTLMERNNIPLWGLETRHSITSYDVIAIAFNYAPFWMNVVKMLKWSGIPTRWKDRRDMKEKWPLIIIGGHIFANPLVTFPVTDQVWLGEAEEAPGQKQGWPSYLDEVEKYKANGMLFDAEGREQMLHEMAVKWDHCMAPRFYSFQHEKIARDSREGEERWEVTGWTREFDDLPIRPRKHFVKDFNESTPLVAPPVPYYGPDMGMGTVQSSKGCSYHCNFCAATHHEVPYRERSQEFMVEAFKQNIINTGADGVSPLTLEFGTYSRKKALMKEVLETVIDEFSMPSLRIDVFGGDPVFGQLAVLGQKKNVTIAIEGNSQKLREIITKGITEDDILKAISNAIAAGYRTAKLYMMCNLPGETAEDHAELVTLAEKIRDLKTSTGSHLRVRFSWKPLTIQAQTGLQWHRARHYEASMSDALKKLNAMGFGTQIGDETRSGLGNYIQMVELADDVAAEAILEASEEANISTYGALPKHIFEKLGRALERHDRTFDDYFRYKDLEEVFAWDVINILVDKPYLRHQYRQMMKRIRGEDMTDGIRMYGQGFLQKFGACSIGCAKCGACDDESLDQMSEFAGRTDEPIKLHEINVIDRKTVRQKFVLTSWLDPDRRFIQRKHWIYAIRRACYKSGINISTNSVHFVTERVKTIKDWFGGQEIIEIGLVSPFAAWEKMPEMLNEYLTPNGLRLHDIYEIPLASKLATRSVEAMLWEVEIDRPMPVLKKMTEDALTREYTELSYRVEGYRKDLTTETVNLRDVLYDAWVTVQGTGAVVVMMLKPFISPYDAANAILGRRADIYRYPAVLRNCFSTVGSSQQNVFTPNCSVCGGVIPLDIFGEPYDASMCPRDHYKNGSRNVPTSPKVQTTEVT